MKKILLIGKLTNIIQNINEWLSEYFNVQICPDSPALVKDMMRTLRPGLVILNTLGEDEVDAKVFNLFRDSYDNTPVMIVASENSEGKYRQYYDNRRFSYMERPISKKQLIDNCCSLLHVKKEKAVNQIPDRIQDAKPAAPETEPAKQETGIIRPEEKKHILVVDDDPILLRSVKAMLEDTYRVSVALSGGQSLGMIQKKRPDLVLLDYEMPGYDGKKTLEMIRENKDISDIPIVFLTGMADKDLVMEVLALKPEGYILKPPVRNKMLKVIEEVLDKRN